MSILSEQTKKMLRATVVKTLTQDALIRRKTYTIDTYGGRLQGSEDVFAKTLLTRVNRTGADMIAAADSGRVYYMAQFAHDTDIRDGDLVVVDAIEYETVQVMQRHGSDVLKQAMVVKAGS